MQYWLRKPQGANARDPPRLPRDRDARHLPAQLLRRPARRARFAAVPPLPAAARHESRAPCRSVLRLHCRLLWRRGMFLYDHVSTKRQTGRSSWFKRKGEQTHVFLEAKMCFSGHVPTKSPVYTRPILCPTFQLGPCGHLSFPSSAVSLHWDIQTLSL